MTQAGTVFWLMNYLIGGILHPFVFGIFLVLVLEPRWPRLPRIAPACALVLASQLPNLVRTLITEDQALFHGAEVVNVALFIGVLLVFFRDGLMKKILALALTAAGVCVAQVLALSVLSATDIAFEIAFDTWEMFVVEVMVTILNMIIYGVFAMVWNRVGNITYFRRRDALFLLFPISQMLLLWHAAHVPMPYQVTAASVGGILAGLLGQLVLFYVVFMQSRQEALEKMLDEVNSAWQREQKNYDAMEKRREQTEKIRHDMKNQLTAALFLMKQNDIHEAQEILEGVKGGILRADAAAVCENPVVNAVMTEKAADCRAAGIGLEMDLNLSRSLCIEPIYLCSSFSNLMDNAITAAAKCDPEKRKIEIAAAQIGDYLHIKVVNTAPRPEKKPRREGHGYGLIILQDIARRHNGAFSGSWAEGSYTALLTLELPARQSPARQ